MSMEVCKSKSFCDSLPSSFCRLLKNLSGVLSQSSCLQMGDLGNFSKFFLILVFNYNYYSTFEFKYVPPSWTGLLLDNRMDFFKPFVAVTSRLWVV
eukprot:scaffold29847_cov74-Cyclotella_meneghiniana.AAC.4